MTLDYPDGRSINYRPGQVFEAREDNPGVIRGLRLNAIRTLTDREAAPLIANKSGTAKVAARKESGKKAESKTDRAKQ